MQKITVACAVSFEDNFLLIKKDRLGKISWDIYVGQVKKHEDILVAAKRETKEKVGLEVEPILKKIYFYHPDGEDVVNFLFVCNLNEKPYVSDIGEIAWFAKDEIEYLLSTGKYEHELARSRFKDLLLGFDANLSFEQL